MRAQEIHADVEPPGAASSVAPGGSPEPAENVERIREILFGPQIRQYAQRFTRLEERLSQENAELRQEVRRRLDSLEAFTRQEMSDLGERLRSERGDRTDSVGRLSQALADGVKALERRLTESDERMANGLRELRQSSFDRITNVVDDLTGQIGAVKVCHRDHIEELRSRSIDRLDLAGLLTELASRIRGEPAAGLEEPDAGSKR